MKKLCTLSTILGIGLLALATGPIVRAQTPPQGSAANADILKMIQAGLPESVVVGKIRDGSGQWDTSVDALIALKKGGATEAELRALTSPTAPQSPAVQSTVVAAVPPPDPAVPVLGGNVTNHNGTVFFNIPSSRDHGSLELRFQVVLVDAHIALKLSTEALASESIGRKGIHTYGDLIFDREGVLYNPCINAGPYWGNPFPKWAPMSADEPIAFPPTEISPSYKKDDLVSEDYKYVEGKGFTYTQYWRPTRLSKKSPWSFKLGETYAQSMASIPARDTLDAIIHNFDATLSQVLQAAGVTDPVTQLSASSHYRRPSQAELDPMISKGNEELAERQRVFELLGKNAFVHQNNNDGGGNSLLSLVNAVQGVANMQQAYHDAKVADLTHDTAGQIRAAANATTAEMQTLGAVSGDATPIQPLAPTLSTQTQPTAAQSTVAVPGQAAQPQTYTKTYTTTQNNGDLVKQTIVAGAPGAQITIQCFAPGQTQPYKTQTFTHSSSSEFFTNLPPVCTRTASATAPPSSGTGTGTAKPPVPYTPASSSGGTVVATNGTICPPSGWIMHQTGDVSVGEQCTPGQPISSTTSSSGSGGSGTGNGGGSGSSDTGGPFDPSLNDCVVYFYKNDPITGDHLILQNNCSVRAQVYFYASSQIHGGVAIDPGATDNTYAAHDQILAAGTLSIYACPVNDIPRKPDGTLAFNGLNNRFLCSQK